MKFRVPLIALGLLVVVASSMQACVSCVPASYLEEVKLSTLPNGTTVLIAELQMGKGRGGGQGRFDVFDPVSGARLQRIAPWFFSAAPPRLRWLGGTGTREWWAVGRQLLLLDFAAGERVATESDVLATNPILRGQLDTMDDDFRVDSGGALLGTGGDGKRYAIDPTTLRATLSEGRLPASASLPDYYARPEGLERVAFHRDGGSFVLTCFTVSSGPCAAEWREDSGKVLWKLSAKDLDGDSILSVKAIDAQTAYLYVASESVPSMLFGGAYLYAVELKTGKVRWSRKL